MTIPIAPTLLIATTVSDTAITLGWADNSSNETSFKVEESDDNQQSWTEIVSTSANTTSYNRTGRTVFTRYYYRVRAHNADGYSAYTNVAYASTFGDQVRIKDITYKVEFDWDLDGDYDFDETDYVVSLRGTHRIASPSQSITASNGRVSECTIVLNNETGRFSSMNAAGSIYTSIQNGKMFHVPVRVKISSVGYGIAESLVTVFTGVGRIPNEDTLSVKQARTITIDCRGNEDLLINTRIRTTQADLLAYNTDGVTEAEFIDNTLDDSGIAATVTVDSGVFSIPWAWINNDPVVEELWRLASACGGRFYADADGVLAYETAMHWLYSPHTTSQQTYERDTGFSHSQLVWDETELAEVIAVSWTERSTGQTGEIYDSDFFSIAPGQEKVIWAELSGAIYRLSSLSFKATTPGGIDLSADVTVTPVYYAQAVKLTIENTGAITATVRIKMEGKLVSEGHGQTEEEISADSFWTAREGRTRKISGNKWVQGTGQVSFLKGLLKDRQETPSLVVKLRGCPGNPSRRIGDRITVIDSEVYLSSTDFYITAITWKYGFQGGYTQDIEAIRCSDVYVYGDSPGYFIINTDTVNSSKKVFY